MFGKLLRQSCERLNLPTNSNEAMACELRTPKRSAAAQYSNAISGDRWPIAFSDGIFIDFQVWFGIAAEARHGELEDRLRSRRNGAEAQRATAARMSMADASLIDIDALRHIVHMCRFNARAVVLMTSPRRIGLFCMVSNHIVLADGGGHSQGRGYQPKQIGGGEKPSPPSSLRSRQAYHRTTNMLQNIGQVERTANSKQPNRISKFGCRRRLLRLPGQTIGSRTYRCFPAILGGPRRGWRGTGTRAGMCTAEMFQGSGQARRGLRSASSACRKWSLRH